MVSKYTFHAFNIYFWFRFIFKYQKSLKRTFEPGFWVQNHPLNMYSRAVNSQRLLCSQKLVWNVRIKALCYTKSISSFIEDIEFQPKIAVFMNWTTVLNIPIYFNLHIHNYKLESQKNRFSKKPRFRVVLTN